tara:strand:- start:145 stop:540 length:396 start_codon:yes stop_codon:yes gene_type:complete
MSKWLYFHASAIDSSSVTSHDTGTNIDFGAFPTDSLTSVMAEEDMVYLYFNNATRFQGSIGSATEVMEQTYVRLTTAEGKEHTVVDHLLSLITKGQTTVIKFDAVTPSWPIENVTAIQIRRHLTTHTIASD